MNSLNRFRGQANNPINGIMQMMNNGMNPQAFANQILQQNPQAKQFLTQIQNQANGRSPKEMALQYAKQQGISEQQLMQLANRMGLK